VLDHCSLAVQVILAMWSREEAHFEGIYYQVRGAINQPKGVQKPHIPLLIGGSGEKVTLKLVAQYGDACNVQGNLATIAHKFAILKEHCEAVGRDYQSIHRTAGTLCAIGETDEQALATLPPMMKFQLSSGSGGLVGSLGNHSEADCGIRGGRCTGIDPCVLRCQDRPGATPTLCQGVYPVKPSGSNRPL